MKKVFSTWLLLFIAPSIMHSAQTLQQNVSPEKPLQKLYEQKQSIIETMKKEYGLKELQTIILQLLESIRPQLIPLQQQLRELLKDPVGNKQSIEIVQQQIETIKNNAMTKDHITLPMLEKRLREIQKNIRDATKKQLEPINRQITMLEKKSQ